MGTQHNRRVLDQVTGTKTKVIDDTTAYLWTATYYDRKYRPIQIVTTNARGNGVNRTTSVYGFVGKVLKTKTAAEGYDIARRFGYDHAGRLLVYI